MGFEEGGNRRSVGGVRDDAIAEQESGAGGGVGHSSSCIWNPKELRNERSFLWVIRVI